MKFITLTSDWGHAAHEIAQIKARLLTALPSAHVLDVTHNIPPFNLTAAAQLISEVIHGFPTGSIHMAWVDTELAQHKRVLIAKYKHQFIVAVDNGFLSLLEIEAKDVAIWEGMGDHSIPFAEKELLLEAAIALANNIGTELPGKPVDSVKTFSLEKPMVEDLKLTGKIIRIDPFGNLTTNIDRSTFEQAKKGRSFKVVLRKSDTHSHIDLTYSGRKEAEMFCIFNAADLLEIGLYRANASKLLGMELGKAVMVEFAG